MGNVGRLGTPSYDELLARLRKGGNGTKPTPEGSPEKHGDNGTEPTPKESHEKHGDNGTKLTPEKSHEKYKPIPAILVLEETDNNGTTDDSTIKTMPYLLGQSTKDKTIRPLNEKQPNPQNDIKAFEGFEVKNLPFSQNGESPDHLTLIIDNPHSNSHGEKEREIIKLPQVGDEYRTTIETSHETYTITVEIFPNQDSLNERWQELNPDQESLDERW
jgi:hypothetical protein